MLASACESKGPAKSEAAAVSHAVTSLREADNQKKSEHLAVLRETPCSIEDVCAVRSACIAAYEHHVQALERIHAAASPSGSASILATVDELKRGLESARKLTNACTEAQGALIRRYKL